MTDKTTPCPWNFTRKTGLGTYAYGREESDGYHSIFSTARKEDGDFILRAINSHDALVEALGNLLYECETAKAHEITYKRFPNALKGAREALTLAREKEAEGK